MRDESFAACGVTRNYLTASKVYVRYLELDFAKINRAHVLLQVCGASNTISDMVRKSGVLIDVCCGGGEPYLLCSVLQCQLVDVQIIVQIANGNVVHHKNSALYV